ncbi:hypothetical protein EDC04DRAFT_2600934 [Pisolithus marmoratus]|nr:hypothetical protein EDC04DRAFT_2600934 [Pisolithus marmoratus]
MKAGLLDVHIDGLVESCLAYFTPRCMTDRKHFSFDWIGAPIDTISGTISVPEGLTAGCLIELPIFGRRGTLFIFTILTGFFILASTTARADGSYLAWRCAYNFTSSVMYGILYAVSSEIFPARTRGTGNAILVSANRIFGLIAPIMAIGASIYFEMWKILSGLKMELQLLVLSMSDTLELNHSNQVVLTELFNPTVEAYDMFDATDKDIFEAVMEVEQVQDGNIDDEPVEASPTRSEALQAMHAFVMQVHEGPQ